MSENYDYLRDDFDLKVLKVADLKRILTEHGVKFNMASRKRDLLSAFEENILPRRAELRAKYIDVIPSASKIEDASDLSAVSSPVRSSRRTTRRKTPEPETDRQAPPAGSAATARLAAASRLDAEAELEAEFAATAELESDLERLVDEDADPLDVPLSPRRAARGLPVRAAAVDAFMSNVPDLKPSAKSAPKAPRSPRSPRRTRRKIASEEPEEEPDIAAVTESITEFVAQTVPERQSEVVAPHEEPAKSPRRRRLTRAVHLPSETQPDSKMAVDNVADVQITSKLPRRPRETEAEEVSFTQDNVFQQHTPERKRKAKAVDEVEDEQPAKVTARPSSASKATKSEEPNISESRIRPSSSESRPKLPSLPRAPPGPRPLPRYAPQASPPKAQAPVAQEPSSPSTRYAPTESKQTPIPKSSPVSDTPIKSSNAEPSSSQISDDGEIDTPFGPELVNQYVYSSPDQPPKNSDTESAVSTPVEPTLAQQEPNRRRGFLPGLGMVRATLEFANQLEPQFSPSPAPTPTQRRSEPEVIPRPYNALAESTFAENSKESEIDEVSEAEKVEPAFDEPDEEIDVDEADADSESEPAAANQSSLEDANVSGSRSVLGKIGVVLKYVPIVALVAGAAVSANWYRETLAAAEFCDVGVATPDPVYPAWTTAPVNIPLPANIADVDRAVLFRDNAEQAAVRAQEIIRDVMDAVRPPCVPCPEHSRCFPGQLIICDEGYRLQASPLAFGGLWPASPHCVEDVVRLRKIEVLAERAVEILRDRSAHVACQPKSLSTGTAEMAEHELHQALLAVKHASLSDEEVDNLWDQVMRHVQRSPDIEVVRHVSPEESSATAAVLTNQQQQEPERQNPKTQVPRGLRDGVGAAAGSGSSDRVGEGAWPKKSTTDGHGSSAVLVSHSLKNASLRCKARLVVLKWAQQHRRALIAVPSSLVVLGAAVSGVLVALRRRRNRDALIQQIISVLQQQRRRADTDRTGVTVGYVTAASLRSRVPPKSWKLVQQLVEKTPGVRVRVLEIHGEITRVWEWVN